MNQRWLTVYDAGPTLVQRLVLDGLILTGTRAEFDKGAIIASCQG